MSVSLLATVDDLIVGLLVGAAIGFLGGPILRSRLVWQEWAAARREASLTDELLARLEASESEGIDEVPRRDNQPGSSTDPLEASVRWRTPR
jgi:hypothetical protein